MRRAVTLAPRRAVLVGGRLAAFLTLVHVAVDSLASIPSALLPTIQARFELTATHLALLVATLSVCSSVTQPLLGALSDRFGRRRVAALGCILTSVFLSLIGVVPSVAVLVFIVAIGGFGSAAFHPAGISIARDAHPRRQGLAVSLFSAGGTVGIALGPILALSGVATFGLDVTPWLMLPGVALGVLLYLLVPDPAPVAQAGRSASLPLHMLIGPVGVLCLAGILNSVAVVTFSSAMPLWLVAQGVARDAPLIGWTLAAFSLSAALGGIVAGWLMPRVDRAQLAGGTMLLAMAPLLAIFWVAPGTPVFFAAVILAGGLVQASVPLLVISAQDLAPDAVATASGMLMGFTTGMAGVLYIGIGRLQEVIGLASAMRLSFLALIPGALLAFVVLSRQRAGLGRPRVTEPGVCSCTVCACTACPYRDVGADAKHAHELLEGAPHPGGKIVLRVVD